MLSGVLRGRPGDINMKEHESQERDRSKELFEQALELNKVLRQEVSEPPPKLREYALAYYKSV